MSDQRRTVRAVTTKVTLAQVAERAGVSLSTASRAVNGDPTRFVRDEVLHRVRRVATDLGYVPDAPAQAVARGRTNTLGLVVSDLRNGPAVTALYAGAGAVAGPGGLSTLVMSGGGDPDGMVECVRAMHRLRARGLMVAFVDDAPDVTADLRAELTSFAGSGGSVCTVGRRLEGISSVTADERGGALALATLVRGAGYRVPRLVATHPVSETTARWCRALADAFDALGAPLPEDAVVTLPEGLLGGSDAVSAVAGSDDGPDLLIAVGEHATMQTVLGVDIGARARSRLVGIASIETTGPTRTERALSHISLPLAEMSKKAAEIALMSPSANVEPRHVVVPVIPRLGESTPPRPA